MDQKLNSAYTMACEEVLTQLIDTLRAELRSGNAGPDTLRGVRIEDTLLHARWTLERVVKLTETLRREELDENLR